MADLYSVVSNGFCAPFGYVEAISFFPSTRFRIHEIHVSIDGTLEIPGEGIDVSILRSDGVGTYTATSSLELNPLDVRAPATSMTAKQFDNYATGSSLSDIVTKFSMKMGQTVMHRWAFGDEPVGKATATDSMSLVLNNFMVDNSFNYTAVALVSA